MAPVDPEPGKRDTETQTEVCFAGHVRPGKRSAQVRQVLVEFAERLRIGRPTLCAGHRLGSLREIPTMPLREFILLGIRQQLGGELLHGLQQREAIVSPPMNETLVDQR